MTVKRTILNQPIQFIYDLKTGKNQLLINQPGIINLYLEKVDWTKAVPKKFEYTMENKKRFKW